MMGRSLVLLGLLALASACSSEAPVADNTARDDASPLAGATVRNPQTANSSLRAEVSTLNADTSGLNTRVTDMGTIIDLPADALFDYDKSTLTPAAETQLQKAAELIRQAPPGAIQVIGHTDSKGDDAYNQKLSEARAKTVADWFGQQVGVRQRELQVSGKGETAPVAPNESADGKDDPAARAKNRRVEVIIPAPQ
ncbi:OmpA family protein [Caenibius sp. WL]|uniref:OmpA family protein n=1 Tax=Caenibius sp. WL TaxID=2872646 RepID=UPI001C9A101C|nr:OmpA family protein [Caenibius sp. WL]QZP08178.1 OmpA family protein [Caenibius sp. WL]